MQMSPSPNPTLIRSEAVFFPPGSSMQVPVTIEFGPSEIAILTPGLERCEPVEKCSITEPLGRLPRHVQFADGSRVTVSDTRGMEDWEKACRKSSGMHKVNRLESLRFGVLICLLLLVGFALIMYFVAIPKASELAAARIPQSINRALTQQTLNTLKVLLSTGDTGLSREDQKLYTDHFNDIVEFLGLDSETTKLVYLKASISNAFALPDGTVCITDSLINDAKDPRQVVGVLAHELVHVKERHAVRSVLQNTSMLVIWALISGDIVSTSNLGAALPIMLAESGYSRSFEFEADRGAGHYMIQKGWSTEPLQSMLATIDVLHEKQDGDQIFEKMSSHPLTRKRIEALRAMDEAAKTPDQQS